MKLNKPGLFRIIGKDFELLANVFGESPTFVITSAINMNEAIQHGIFKVLDENSLEIQMVYQNPDNFVFIEYEYSEICQLPPYRQSIRGSKIPEIKESLYEEFKQRYINDVRITKRGVAATKAYIMQKTDWSLAQINIVVMKIAKECSKMSYL